MITLKTMKQIATSKTIASSRSSSLLGKNQVAKSDQARCAAGVAQMLAQEARRQWLDAAYYGRLH